MSKGFDWQAFINAIPTGEPDLIPTPFGLQLMAVDDATGAINLIFPPQTGQAGKVLTTDGNEVSWETPAGGGGTWGSITGTLSSQTDLQNALNAKQATAGVLALGGFSSITGRIGNTNLPLGAQLYDSAGTPTVSGDFAGRRLLSPDGLTEAVNWSDPAVFNFFDGNVAIYPNGVISAYLLGSIVGDAGHVLIDPQQGLISTPDGTLVMSYDANNLVIDPAGNAWTFPLNGGDAPQFNIRGNLMSATNSLVVNSGDRTLVNSEGSPALDWSAPDETVSNSGLRLLHRLVAAHSVLTYSASMTPAAYDANSFTVTATNGTAFTMNAPGSPSPHAGQFITITIRNTSGGALGAATWNATYKMATWTQPANGFSRSITFCYDGANWVETSRTPADVPN